MRKIFFAIAVISVGLTACDPVEEYITTPTEIILSVSEKNLHSSQFTVDITPKNDKVYYFCDVIEKGRLIPNTGRDLRFMQLTLDSLYRDYIDWRYDLLRENSRYVTSFSDHCLSYGNDSRFFISLKPETEYMAYAYCVNPDNNQPMGNLYYTYVTTKARTKSDMTFKWTMHGTRIMVTPSNDDEYYLFSVFNYNDVNEKYGGPDKYAEKAIEIYQSMGLLKDELSRGIDELDFASYLTKIGEKYYLMIAGFDGEMTTKVFSYVFIYTGDEYPIILEDPTGDYTGENKNKTEDDTEDPVETPPVN